jgi:hypothetical protein
MVSSAKTCVSSRSSLPRRGSSRVVPAGGRADTPTARARSDSSLLYARPERDPGGGCTLTPANGKFIIPFAPAPQILIPFVCRRSAFSQHRATTVPVPTLAAAQHSLATRPQRRPPQQPVAPSEPSSTESLEAFDGAPQAPYRGEEELRWLRLWRSHRSASGSSGGTLAPCQLPGPAGRAGGHSRRSGAHRRCLRRSFAVRLPATCRPLGVSFVTRANRATSPGRSRA